MSCADPEHHRDRAQRAEDAADPERVADRLAQAVGGGDLEVEQRRRVAADLDHVDHVVGARRARARRSRWASMRGAAAERAGRVAGHRLGRPPAARGRCRAGRSRRPASSGNERMSPSRFLVNSTLPAPMKAIRGMIESVPHRAESSKSVHDVREARSPAAVHPRGGAGRRRRRSAGQPAVDAGPGRGRHVARGIARVQARAGDGARACGERAPARSRDRASGRRRPRASCLQTRGCSCRSR